jgi:predicted component of type VI protein secretion system
MTVDERLRGLPVTITPPASTRELRWRRLQLIEAGFDELTAHQLAARTDVDLHLVLTLLDQVSPPSLARRIVIAMVVRHG